MDRISYGLGRINYKNSYLNNYSEKLSCQANCFSFQSNQDSFFFKHIKFENRKGPKNTISEEYQKRGILKDGGIFACQKIRKKKFLLRGCKSVHR